MQKQVHQTCFGSWTQLARRFKDLPGRKALAAGLLLAGSLLATNTQAQITTIVSDDFETGGTAWTIVNGTQVNQWVIGTATAASGTQSAYISNDAGVTNTYTITTSSTTHIYQDITFPAGQTDFQLTFKWKAQGDGTTDLDNLKVFASATSASVTAGTAMPAADRIGATWYNLAGTSYTTTTINLPSNFAGTTRRIVFSWKNNATIGTQPPASIDDITITSRAAVPISGVYTINNTLPTAGTNFASFTDAFTKLNTEGISGPLTLNVSAGQTFTELPPALIATGTAANPIVVQKSGTGANPLIVAAPGVSTTADGIIVIAGTDYITFDGIDVQDPATNTSTTTQIEWGYAILKASNTNGSQFVTIKNATITLQKIRTTSVGIYSASHTPASTTDLSTTGATPDGANSNNQFFSNTISNVNTGIRLEGSSAAGMYDVNNQVGVGGANTITNFGGTSTTSYSIYSIYQNNYKIANNSINGGTGSTSTQYGIFMSTATNANIEIFNNDVNITTSSTSSEAHGITNGGGSTGTNNLVKIYGNTVQITTAGASSTGTIYGIYNTATAFNVDIYNNTIASITRVGTGTTYGIYQSASVVNKANIYNNTIKDLSSTGASTMYALYTASAASTDIYGNTINNVTTTSATVNGMYLASGALVNVFNNQIFNLTSTSTSAALIGIQNWNAPTAHIYNNFISDLKAPVATAADAVRGIYINGGSTYNGVFYNTIYLNASSSSATTFGTSGILVNTTYPVDIRNNIIVNNSVPGPTGGLTVAYRRSTTTLTNYAATSDNNIFYAGTPAANRVIFYDGTNADQTLAAYKARVAPRDANSTSELPPFVNVTTAPYDLHLSTTIATSAESGATPVTTPIAITTDFDGNPRNATTPDRGADEGNFIPRDLVAPLITHTPAGNTSSTTNRVITASISDDSGIPTTGSVVPRVYFRKGTTGGYVSQAGTLTSGTGTNGTWSFTIDYSLVGGITAGDVIDYYIIAQDINGNISSVPTGAVATDVNNVTSVAFIYRYYIGAPIAAAITVPGTYASLTNPGGLFDAINKSVLTGNVIVEITGDLTAETGAVGLNQWAEEGAGAYSLTIRPDAAVNRTISGSSPASSGLIRIAGADRVTIDGRFNGAGNFLTIVNTNTVAQTFALLGFSGAVDNTYRNLNLSTGTNAEVSVGIFAAGANNHNMLIENNNITKAYYGILIQNDAVNQSNGVQVLNNTIGSQTPADYVTFRGITATNSPAAVISGNTIFNLKLSTAVSNAGIEVGQNMANAMVTRNNISGIYSTNTGGWGAYGILISSGTGTSNVTLANNMISDIITDGDAASTLYNPFGIRITGGINHKIYYNSINLAGAFTNATTSDISAAIIITSSTVTGLDIRNNIFANSLANGGATTKSYAIYAVSGTTFGTINYNNYYATGAKAVFGYLGSDKATLADWRTATTQDANSISVDPMFNSATDLHVASSNLAMNNMGTPIAAVTTDYDGDVRNATTPDIGADEFSPAALDLGATALVSPTVKSCYSAAEQVTVTIQNLGLASVDFAATNVSVTLQVSIGGVPQTPIVIPVTDNSLNGGTPLAVGATLNVPVTSAFNMAAPGTYTFNAFTTVTSGGIDGNASNNDMTAVNLTVSPVTAGTASATQATLCQSGTTTLNLSGHAGGDIQWQQGTSATGPFTNITGATAAAFTPAAPLTATTYFQAIISCGVNADTSNMVTVTVTNPVITASAGDTRCGAGAVTLSATPSAGYTINWYDAATGGVPVATGTTYSPNVTATTTYYATATTGGGTFNVGAPNNAIGAGGATGTTAYYQIFDVLAPLTLEHVYVYPAAAGNVVLHLSNNAGTILQTITVPVTAANVNQKTLIPINYPLTAGTGYRLGWHTGGVNLYRNTAGATYPYTVPGLISITGSSFVGYPQYWYYVYDFQVSNGCESARTPVVATVNPAPMVSLGPDVTQCGTAPVTLDAGNAGATYQWTLNGNAISGATAQTLSATTGGTYVVTVTNTSNCSATDTVVVTMNAAAATPTITIAAGGSATFCQGGSVTLNGASATTGVTFQWFNNGTAVPGATSASYTANAAGSYTVVASVNGCASAASAATAVTVNPKPTTPVITKTGNQLSVPATTGATYQWFSVAGSALTAVPGATAVTFTPATNGDYTVRVTVNGCESDAASAMNVVLGIASLAPGMEVSVYPNPTAGKFTVNLVGFEKEAMVQIISVTGQVISETKVSITSDKTSKAFDLGGMAKGIYILKVTSGNNLTFRKVILD